MKRGFTYRMYPTKAQAKQLDRQLEECRWLYNHFLEERQKAYKKSKKQLSQYDQQNGIPRLRNKQRPSLETVLAQCLQNVTQRVDLAYKAFFRRCQNGEKPGYPRFKQFGRYDSVTYPQIPNGCKIVNGRLRLFGIEGKIKMIINRPLEGKPKTCTLRKSSTGKWYASFACETETPGTVKPDSSQVGIDIGLSTFATMSDGSEIKRERFFKRDEKDLARAQHRLSKATRGTPERKRLRKPVSRIHERIRNRRKNFAHQHSRSIVNKYGLIAVENIQTNQLIHKGTCTLRKSISDVAWSQFFTFLTYKAEEAGRVLVKVNPAFTSQTCSSCGHRQPMPLTERVFVCPCCNMTADRDHNAAQNILSLGLQAVGKIPKSLTSRRRK